MVDGIYPIYQIIDCLKSGCAVMAICWEKHSGYTYLKREDAAICINDPNMIYNTILKLTSDSKLINEYKEKAYNCAVKNHLRNDVQEMLFNDFNSIIETNNTQS